MIKLTRLAEEPFRLFFPLGLLASAIGVLLWPAVFAGWIDYYPLEAHARWMVIGLGGCFITGFLGTAGPRLLGTRPFHRAELLLHLALSLAVMVALGVNRITTADGLTGIWLISLLASLLGRFLFARQDVPPPGLPLAVLGIAGAATAAIILGLGIPTSLAVHQFLRLLYFQGFLWLPILGVAPYLLPRFFGKPSPHSFDESLTIPAGWMRPFLESLAAGLLLIASFALEAWGHGRAGHILRAVVVTLHLARSVPGLFAWGKVNGLGLAVRWVVPCAAGGWLLAVAFPHLRVGGLHLMFIGGAGLLMLAAATRVILGHNNRHDRLSSPLRWCHALWAMVLFTAATRLTSEFIPKVRVSHFIYAALMWLFVLLFWSWKLRRELRQPVFEEGVLKSRCPRKRKSLERAGRPPTDPSRC
ncbi:NnrS family protein [Haloferula sp.]|uniref:NnrS family protein n=1 Tax=Haloferula sp. TaxID=2497595 RepID=UPI003C7627F3